MWSTECCMWFCERASLNLFFTRGYITSISMVNISDWWRQCVKWYNVVIYHCPAHSLPPVRLFLLFQERERIIFSGLSRYRSFQSIGSFIQAYSPTLKSYFRQVHVLDWCRIDGSQCVNKIWYMSDGMHRWKSGLTVATMVTAIMLRFFSTMHYQLALVYQSTSQFLFWWACPTLRILIIGVKFVMVKQFISTRQWIHWVATLHLNRRVLVFFLHFVPNLVQPTNTVHVTHIGT